MVPLIWGLAYASGRRVTLVVLKRTALAGALFGINMTFLFASLQHASVAVISVVQALTPGIVLLIAGPWLGERATVQHVLWTGLGITGVIVVVIGGDPEVSGDAFGFIAAAISTLSFVGYYVINRHMRSTTTIDPLQWMAGVTLFAALAVTPGAVITASPDDFGRVGAADWAYLGFIAVVVGVISHVTMSWAHAYVPASRSSPALLGANVVAIGVAWPLHDEPVTWVQVAGGIVVLASVLAILRKPTVAVVPRTRPSAEPDEPALPTV
jgi:drug/metabolite transporter (DMT)-like permease